MSLLITKYVGRSIFSNLLSWKSKLLVFIFPLLYYLKISCNTPRKLYKWKTNNVRNTSFILMQVYFLLNKKITYKKTMTFYPKLASSGLKSKSNDDNRQLNKKCKAIYMVKFIKSHRGGGKPFFLLTSWSYFKEFLISFKLLFTKKLNYFLRYDCLKLGRITGTL